MRLQSAALETTANAIVIADRQGLIQWVNPAAERLTGYSAAELIGQNPRLFKSNKHDTAFYKAMWDTVLANQPWHGELVNKRKNGSLYSEEMTITPITDSFGEITHFVAVKQDITARKQAEISLLESEEAMRVVFNSTYDGILLHTPDGKVFDANETFLRMYGVPPEQFPSVTIESISSPSMSMETAREIWARVLAGEPHLFEWKARRFDNGCEFDVEVFLRRVRLRGQNTILANVRDLTSRKQAEVVLREQAQLAHLRADATQALQQPAAMRALLQSVTALLVERLDAAFARVWTVDPSGQMLELQASAGLYTHLDGAHSRVPVGQFKIGRIALERRPLVTNQVIGDPHVPGQEWARREGLISFAGVPLLLEGRLLGVVAFFARHTLSPSAIETFGAVAGALAQAIGRKQAEEALHQAGARLAEANANLERRVHERTARLQEAVADLEHMSYSMIHDMRAPLRAMTSYAQLLIEGAQTRLLAHEMEYLHCIITSAARMDHLVADALDYNKAVREDFSVSPVDAGALLRGMLATYSEFQPPHAEIRLEGEFPRVLGNPGALTQCFSHLLQNAVKFVAQGKLPRVRIWVESTEQSSASTPQPTSSATPSDPGSPIKNQNAKIKNGMVRFWFEDNGIGMPQEGRHRIFDMFHRLHGSPYAGTGIGLALVRKLVERMGGRLGVESEEGKGSRFWVELKSPDNG